MPTSSITQDGETLYFQGWMKNGVVSTIYTPNETVEDVNITDVFIPYYAKDADYPELTFTVDGVTGEYILTGANKNITSVTIPALYQGDIVSVVNDRAFYSYSSLQEVTLPQTITKIGDYAFSYCTKLTEIIIPYSVTSISSSAFSYSGLASITIPDNVTSIGGMVFVGCNWLTSINVDSENQNYCSVDGVLFNKDMTTLMQYPIGKTDTSYTIPDSVTSIMRNAFHYAKLATVTIANSVTRIGDYAFAECVNLTEITIPKGVTSMDGTAFSGCSSLTAINVDSGNQDYSSINGALFDKNATRLIQYPIGKTDTSYTIPKSVTSISSKAFYKCANLTSINADSESQNYSSIDGVLFNKNATTLIFYPIGKTNTNYIIPNSVATIYQGAFHSCSNLTSITIPNSVTYIGVEAFRECSSLTSITIPTSVETIYAYTFYGCTSLVSVTISSGVANICNSAFRYCTNLTSITIPDSIERIEAYVFSLCYKLSSVTFENTTGWYATSSSDFTGGDAIDVTNPTTNATNLLTGSWDNKYLYR